MNWDNHVQDFCTVAKFKEISVLSPLCKSLCSNKCAKLSIDKIMTYNIIMADVKGEQYAGIIKINIRLHMLKAKGRYCLLDS